MLRLILISRIRRSIVVIPVLSSSVAPGAATHDMVIGADDAAPLVVSCVAPGAATIIARHDVPGEDSSSTRKAGSLHGVIEAQTDIFGSYPKTIKSKPAPSPIFRTLCKSSYS